MCPALDRTCVATREEEEELLGHEHLCPLVNSLISCGGMSPCAPLITPVTVV